MSWLGGRSIPASSGTGIASVHVWAFPVAGGSPTFVGVASYGGARPDIGAVFGDRFTNAGFSLKVQNLTHGTYDIAVYGWSTVSNTFRAVATVRVTVM